MTWSFSWRGPATDFDSGLPQIDGKADIVSQAALAAAFEAAQTVGIGNPQAVVLITANGFENRGDQAGTGRFDLTVSVYPPQTEIQSALEAQQPVDLLHSQSDAVIPSTAEAGQPAVNE